jgi:hypothetical protein
MAASLVAAAALGFVVPTAGSSASAVETQILRFVHDGPGNGQLLYHASEQLAPGAFVAFIEVRDAQSRMPAVSGDIGDVDQFSQVRTFGMLGRHDVCPGAEAVCVVSPDGSAVITGGAGGLGNPATATHLREYIIIRGINVHFSLDQADGWRRLKSGGSALRILDTDASGGGVEAIGDEIAVATGARAPGYAQGSVALAVAPCDLAGIGSLRLTGGTSPQSATCASPVTGSLARGRTAWVTAGTVVGVSHYATRLLVVSA